MLTFQRGSGSMAISRPSGQRALIAMAFPLPPERSPLQALGTATALLVLHDPNSRPQPIQETLCQIFSLSPSEARVATAIGSGETVEEAAIRFGVSVNTVRAQLKQVFSKLGVRRQSELVSLLTRIGATASWH